MDIIKCNSHTIYYNCDCGSLGKCYLRPTENDIIVIDVTCPSCGNTERVTLLKYNDENRKRKMIEQIKKNKVNLSWVPFITEDVVETE